MGKPIIPVAPGKTNTVVAPNVIERLPLGHRTTAPKPYGQARWFWLSIPTNTGGELTVTHEEGGTVGLYKPDMTTKLAGGDSSKLVHSVVAPFWGILYVLAEGGKAPDVSAEFVQVSFARNGAKKTDTPIVPWNFFFWPASRRYDSGEEAKKVLAMIRKYAKAYKKSEDDAAKWEFECHQTSDDDGWVGHCHNAAAASILFEEPVATTVNNEAFNEEELEYVAAEWFGNYGTLRRPFTIQRGVATYMDIDKLYPPMAFRPGKPKTPEELAASIRAWKPSISAADAKKRADGTFAQTSYAPALKKYFSEAAAAFYSTLGAEMRIGRHALLADLKATDPKAGSNEIWNHAVFYYKAVFQETDPSKSDPNDVLVKITLLANADQRPSPGLPATITKDNKVDVSSVSQPRRTSIQLLRLIFERGEISESDPRNEWRSSKASENGDELYAPGYLDVVGQVDAVNDPRRVSDGSFLGNLEVGNPYVEREAVAGTSPVLKIRKRYKI